MVETTSCLIKDIPLEDWNNFKSKLSKTITINDVFLIIIKNFKGLKGGENQ